MLLAALGSVLGVGLAWAALRGLVAIGPSGLPRLEEIGMDSTVLLFDISLATDRFSMWLAGLFGFIALALASVGIYGVLAHTVEHRAKELGIRMALGADGGAVRQLVLRHGAVLTAIGLTLGLVGAFWLTRFMANQLYGATATDPITFGGVVALLAIVALLASYVPVRRVTCVDLREESMKRTGAWLAVRALEKLGIRYTFGIPGVHTTELYDELDKSDSITPILVTHEGGGAFMADALSRTTDTVGCLAIVPAAGMTHAMSGIGEAFLDGVPLLVIAAGDLGRGAARYRASLPAPRRRPGTDPGWHHQGRVAR